MAQVMVNFRMDEDVKKSMEQACREMGLSMTTAFTIFATKVGREKRIPFEITAEPRGPERRPAEEDERQARAEMLCRDIRRSLTAIHTAIPASVTGLSMERIRLLCGDELKDQAAAASRALSGLFSGRNAGALREKDGTILEEYMDGLSSIAEELGELERALVPALRARPGGDAGGFEAYERRLAAVSREFDGLEPVLRRFWESSAPRHGSARFVQARLRQAAAGVETAGVLTALEDLEALVLRHYAGLDGQARTRLEAHYLPTLELTLRELGRAEQGEEEGKAALCLRAISVLSRMLSDSGRTRRELGERSLEAEVEALERLAAMRGDAAARP